MIEILTDPMDVEGRLRDAAIAARNVTGRGADGYHLMVAFIEWADEWARMLRPRIGDFELSRLVLVPEYWALRGHTPDEFGQGFTLRIQNELLLRESELSAAADGIVRERQRWSGFDHEPIAVILDTGVLLEYGDQLLDVDWHSALEVRPHRYLYLVVTRVAIDELDRLKQSRTQGASGEWKRTQARAAIRSLWSMFGSKELSSGYERPSLIPVRRVRFELVADDLEHVQLDDPDAEILDRSRTLAPFIPTQVATFDIGMALRGIASGVQVMRLSQPPHDHENKTQAPSSTRES